MATQQELMGILERAAYRAEDTADAEREVLVSEGEKDVTLSDGTVTPNLNKRIKLLGSQVTSVVGKKGDITINDISEKLELGSASKYNVADLPISSAQGAINDKTIKNGDYPPLLGAPVRLRLNTQKCSLVYGLNDPLPLDDNRNFFRGLANKNAWALENIGGGGFSVGRNGCPKAYLGSTFGHDCITYGTASLAGGAGSGTGNPDEPTKDAEFGYCSLAFGKDTLAMGRISTAFGQNNTAGTLHSFASGYECETGKGLATHPVLSGSGVNDGGESAFVHGYRAFAYGNYSLAFGNCVRAYHGSKVIGSGINAGTLLEGLVPRSLVLGVGVDVPTVIMTRGDGTIGAFGKIGFNTKYEPRERVEIVIKPLDKVAIRASTGGGSVDLQSTLNTGASASIFRIEYTSPNAGQPNGITNFYQNNQNWLSLNVSGDPTFKKPVNSFYGYQVDGKRVIGGQVEHVPDLPTNATLLDTIAKLNDIIAVLRDRHGLIAKS